MNTDQLGVLTRAFTDIKTRPGRNGQSLSYIEGHAVIERLNEAFSGQWSFYILDHRITDDQVIVLAELRVNDLVKQAFGGSDVTRAKESGKPISISDDLKSAATDALKKAATLLGVGLHLYSGNGVPTEDPATDPLPHGLGLNGNGTRLSRKQLSFIHSLARDRGIDRTQLDDMAKSLFSTRSAHLSVHDASAFIQHLQQPNN